jgi:hypothetical protein
MNIRNDIANEFRRAVNDPQNIMNGNPIWDFVEADIMIEVGLDNIIEQMGSLSEFFAYFNELVDLQLAMEAA